ncbi:MAG: TolC family protein, partial [bacterium]|nr:TolC family protein [bacterium]
MEDAVSRALASHPLIKAGEHRITASEAAGRQAGLSPNPTFTFQQENIRSWANQDIPYWTATDTFAVLTHTFETKGKRKRRVESASFEVQRAELERELLGKRIASRVKRAYWATAGAQRIHQLLLETAKNFLLIVEYHEVRVREGAMAEADLLRIRLENERLNLAATTAFLEVERARIALFREMGQADIPDEIQLDQLDPPSPGSVDADEATALTERTEMKLGRLAMELGRAELSLARANARPDVDGIFGYKRGAGFNSLVAGV